MGKLHSYLQARTKQTSNKGTLATLLKFIKMHWHAQPHFCLGIPGKQRQALQFGDYLIMSPPLSQVCFYKCECHDPSTIILSKPTGCLSGRDPSYKRLALLLHHGSVTRVIAVYSAPSEEAIQLWLQTSNLSDATSSHRTDS